MAMLHLKYPKKKGYFAWDELRCLARALGFQDNIFFRNIPEEYTKGENGVTFKEFVEMVEVHKYFHPAFDCTINMHSDEWNLNVVKRAVSLLDRRLISFEELLSVRLAYQLYEGGDTKGLMLQRKTMLRALKLCDRVIAPLKMSQRLKHMRPHFEEKGRIQLHEFLDLMLWCDKYKAVNVDPTQHSISKGNETMYPLEDFTDFLSHGDERLQGALNAAFLTEERRYSKERHTSHKMPKDVPPVDSGVRDKQVRYHARRYRALHCELRDSQTRVQEARAGAVRARPVTAPDLTMYEAVDPSTMAVSTLDPRPRSVMDTVGFLIRPPPGYSPPAPTELPPRPCPSPCRRPTTPAAVVPDDVMQLQRDLQSLWFEIETTDMKYQQYLEDGLDDMLPGYRDKVANRPPPPPPPPAPRVRPPPRPSSATLHRLAYRRPAHPSPAHGRSCDARHRGWQQTRSRGSHVVLCTPSYDEGSEQGRLLTRLHTHTRDQSGRGQYIHRHTATTTRRPGNPDSCPPTPTTTSRRPGNPDSCPPTPTTASSTRGGPVFFPPSPRRPGRPAATRPVAAQIAMANDASAINATQKSAQVRSDSAVVSGSDPATVTKTKDTRNGGADGDVHSVDTSSDISWGDLQMYQDSDGQAETSSATKKPQQMAAPDDARSLAASGAHRPLNIVVHKLDDIQETAEEDTHSVPDIHPNGRPNADNIKQQHRSERRSNNEATKQNASQQYTARASVPSNQGLFVCSTKSPAVVRSARRKKQRSLARLADRIEGAGSVDMQRRLARGSPVRGNSRALLVC